MSIWREGHRPEHPPDRRHALQLLAARKDDCTEGILRANGFSISDMAELVRAKLASATAERVVAGSPKMEIARVSAQRRRSLTP